MSFAVVYHDQDSVDRMASLVSPRVEAFVHRLLGIASYEYSDGRYPGFSSEIVGCHFPLTDAHVEHINRVVVGHLMLRCGHLVYFANRLDPTLTRDHRQSFDLQLQDLGQLFRGQCNPPGMDSPLKQSLVFALAILHDIGKTAFLGNEEHEERAGKLVRAILGRLRTQLGISDTEIDLGRNLVENHTMLGTLVQAEHSAQGVLQYLCRSCNTRDEKRMFLSYLLLLNSMDLSGYRYFPIVLDPYWTERYIEFSNLQNLEKYANGYEEFASYRLRQLARNDVSDVGESDEKQEFHHACESEFEKLNEELKKEIGTMRIRDALYLIIDFNRAAVGHSRRFPVEHAVTYVGFLKALAEIASRTCAHTVAFRGDGSRTVDEKRLSLFVHRIQNGLSVCEPSAFASREGVVQFTIDSDGTIVPWGERQVSNKVISADVLAE